MASPILKIKGINADVARKLRKHNISDADQLLRATSTPTGRDDLAKKLNIDVRTVLEYANRADLARVNGI